MSLTIIRDFIMHYPKGGKASMDFSLEQVIAVAKSLRYAPLDRAEKWLERLGMNRPEFEAFEAFPKNPLSHQYTVTANVAREVTGIEKEPFANFTWKPRADLATGIRHCAFITADTEAFAAAKVPVGIKDLMRVDGYPLTGGTQEKDMKGFAQEATVVARLRAAGAQVVGTTNLHELAYGVTSRNPHHGCVVNAVDRDLTPGGSSGGSAVAVALGLVPFAVGTDTAGSIRIPAACNGVVGLKPSYGALPTDGVVSLGWSLDHVGPIATNLDWTAWAFAAMLGLEAVPKLDSVDTSKTRLGFLGGYFEAPLEEVCRQGLERTKEAASRLGYKVQAGLQAEHAQSTAAIQFFTLAPEATSYHLKRLHDLGQNLGEDVRVRLEAGLFLPGFTYPKAQSMRQAWSQSLDTLFDSHDVLVSATLRCLPPNTDATQVSVEGKTFAAHTAMTQLTMPFNLTGHPAITLPVPGFGKGLTSIQLIGRRGEDWKLLAVAKAIESQLQS